MKTIKKFLVLKAFFNYLEFDEIILVVHLEKWEFQLKNQLLLKKQLNLRDSKILKFFI